MLLVLIPSSPLEDVATGKHDLVEPVACARRQVALLRPALGGNGVERASHKLAEGGRWEVDTASMKVRVVEWCAWVVVGGEVRGNGAYYGTYVPTSPG